MLKSVQGQTFLLVCAKIHQALVQEILFCAMDETLSALMGLVPALILFLTNF